MLRCCLTVPSLRAIALEHVDLTPRRAVDLETGARLVDARSDLARRIRQIRTRYHGEKKIQKAMRRLVHEYPADMGMAIIRSLTFGRFPAAGFGWEFNMYQIVRPAHDRPDMWDIEAFRRSDFSS